MRAFPVALAALLLVAVAAVPAQGPATPRGDSRPDGAKSPQYRIEIDKVFAATRERQGLKALFVTVQFKVQSAADGRQANVGKHEIVVEEDRQKVAGLEVFAPQGSDQLTTVLAIDTSGSMTEGGKMDQAKRAALLFLDRLHDRADTGLILFNHELLLPTEKPVGEKQLFAAHRQRLRERIMAAQPGGGTAYLDAAAEAVAMLQGTEGRKAVLVMTDGVDLNSKHSLKEVIDLAQGAEVPVYTIGVGEPGKNEPVTTVMVLDHSGSMSRPADDVDRIPKIEALHRAAARFVDIMRPGARTTLLPFSDRPEKPKPFNNNKDELKNDIRQLKARGNTALYDATYDGIMTLQAEQPEGKRAVVVLTDGKDEPGSRHRVEEVIDLARQTKTPLYMLGLGRPGEINKEVMQRMADETGGKFYHAQNEKALLAIFENLSIQLHDDGVDEASLKKLAEETGGQYYPARDIKNLHLIYETLAQELQSTYTVTFPSRRASHDGTARGIDISVVRNGVRVSDVARADYNVHGVVVPEMDARVYLALLGFLGVLLAVPTGVRRLYRFYGGT